MLKWVHRWLLLRTADREITILIEALTSCSEPAHITLDRNIGNLMHRGAGELSCRCFAAGWLGSGSCERLVQISLVSYAFAAEGYGATYFLERRLDVAQRLEQMKCGE